MRTLLQMGRPLQVVRFVRNRQVCEAVDTGQLRLAFLIAYTYILILYLAVLC